MRTQWTSDAPLRYYAVRGFLLVGQHLFWNFGVGQNVPSVHSRGCYDLWEEVHVN